MRRLADLRFELALVLLGALLYLPFLAAPLGPQEINAGYFFGPFANSYQRFGFFPLRGVPLGTIEFVPATPEAGMPYLNHPPGTAWLCCTGCDAEWRLRLPTALAAIAAGVLLFRLLRDRMPPWAAACAGLLLQTAPALAFYGQVSYEAPVVCCGLALWLAFARAGSGNRRARRGLFAAALIGPWFDWSFGFFVAALPLFAEWTSVRAVIRRLLLPWATALGSLALVGLWLWWAGSAPFMQADRPPVHPPGYIGSVVLHWPPLGEFLRGTFEQLQLCYTPPLATAALLGWLLAARTRFHLSLAVPGILQILVFPSHAASHTMFLALLAPAVAAAAGALLASCRSAGAAPWAVAAGAALLVGMTATSTLDLLVRNRSTLLRELGAVLTAAAETGPGPAPLVGTNAYNFYPYYVRSGRVELFPVSDPRVLQRLHGGGNPIRFLLVEADVYSDRGEAVRGPISQDGVRPLAEYLHQFPGQRVDRLEGSWPLAGGYRLDVARATLYDL